MRRVLMIAGEASGDLHGAGVVRELKKRIPSLNIFGIGGKHMREEGMELLFDISDLSFMGFVEVAKNISLIRAVESRLELVLHERRPDVVVLIDYPGFNLRFARRVKKHGIKVLYYISPQVWAWKKGRVKKIKRLVDKMKVVFPFEVEIYRNAGVDVEFVGHPLAERIGSSISRGEFFRTHGFDQGAKLLGLFPGSRRQEVEKIFPTMLKAAVSLQHSHGIHIAVGAAHNLSGEFLRTFLPEGERIHLIENSTYELMKHSDLAFVTSGTATLEAGWFGIPMVVVYKTSAITFTIGRMLVRLPYIGLVNIVAGRKVVPEFIQQDMTVSNLITVAIRILEDNAYSEGLRKDLASIKEKLGGPGASERVAEEIISLGRAA